MLNHAAVNRFVLLVAGVCVAVVVGFASWVSPRHDASGTAEAVSAPGDGASPGGALDAELFEARCGTCHRADELVAYLLTTGDVDARARHLRTVLADHGSATTDENARIVAFLVGAAKEESRRSLSTPTW